MKGLGSCEILVGIYQSPRAMYVVKHDITSLKTVIVIPSIQCMASVRTWALVLLNETKDPPDLPVVPPSTLTRPVSRWPIWNCNVWMTGSNISFLLPCATQLSLATLKSHKVCTVLIFHLNENSAGQSFFFSRRQQSHSFWEFLVFWMTWRFITVFTRAPVLDPVLSNIWDFTMTAEMSWDVAPSVCWRFTDVAEEHAPCIFIVIKTWGWSEIVSSIQMPASLHDVTSVQINSVHVLPRSLCEIRFNIYLSCEHRVLFLSLSNKNFTWNYCQSCACYMFREWKQVCN